MNWWNSASWLDGVIDRFVDVLRRVLFQADDGGSQHADAVGLQRREPSAACRRQSSLAYCAFLPSRPIQTHEMPRRTS